MAYTNAELPSTFYTTTYISQREQLINWAMEIWKEDKAKAIRIIDVAQKMRT